MGTTELVEEVLKGAPIEEPAPTEDNLEEAAAETPAEPVSESEEVAGMAEFTEKVHAVTREFTDESEKPLILVPVRSNGEPIKPGETPDHWKIESGIFWLPSLVEPAGGWPVKKTRTGKTIKPKVSAAAKRRAILAGWAETLAWGYNVDTAYAA